jgi:hypothetical protein
MTASVVVAALWLDIPCSPSGVPAPGGPILHCGNMAALFPGRFKHVFALQ